MAKKDGKFWFTFGKSHEKKIGNNLFNIDCICEVEAETYIEARNKMFNAFGDQWEFGYIHLHEVVPEYYPRGIIIL